ncbi:tRNA (uracil(54)-C(5))-methyltransferase [Aspergillus saccharolyticus JOP 1030-1]|uniref:tRNA (uracil(54)-C(5))-methyltransferase n=1 Tax=Aspergillus saccharolyticus JOP 1030-1 TaxID=1450539 RepID=A0A318ZIW4_9EURO|nr:S-adenosyl-L-methionine-dependent methyltransferase [Aspergillus saccharolyticus JOP 1030-1]PYH44513.1 S-adenosyl-L-methionine-dependent methyltransferase [Aspergillus saccharolyticus JOP 1030-1]
MFALRSLRLFSQRLPSRLSLQTPPRLVHTRPHPDIDQRLSAVVRNMQNAPKKPANPPKRRKQLRNEKLKGFDEVLQADIDALLRKHKPETEVEYLTPQEPALPELFSEIEVQVAEISSTGDGLALSEKQDHVYVVPFSVPGDKVLIKVVRHFASLQYTLADFIKVVEPGPQRNDAGIGCQYFGKCSGCQLQMMSYEDQLAHKKRIVEKAYANFSGLIPELIPAIGDTFPSPLQYGYRTKLTPHFAAPPGSGRGRRNKDSGVRHTEVPPIGFTYKNRRTDLDIEDCPLGTEIVRQGLKSERKRVAERLSTYSQGATLLLRESTSRIPKGDQAAAAKTEWPRTDDLNHINDYSADLIRNETDTYTEEKRCVTNPNATTVEYVDNYVFTNKAGAFFQNNNSILTGFTDYIRQHALAPPPSTNPSSSTSTSTPNDPSTQPIKYLLDAYSGSGLFTITLSPLFKSSLGVDVAGDSILSARQNARANALPNTGFAAADAAVLFKDVPYPADQTLLVIDPPRKGCSDDFLRQLLAYGPKRVVYVSCNVHTQARDVGVMVQGSPVHKIRYEIESIRGFDFFPQTGHVEGVAVLNRVAIPEGEGESA